MQENCIILANGHVKTVCFLKFKMIGTTLLQQGNSKGDFYLVIVFCVIAASYTCQVCKC